MFLKDLSLETLHHAYVLEGADRTREAVQTTLAELLGASFTNNPDVYTATLDSFGIDDARALREHLSLKPMGVLSVALIQTHQVTVDAQSALLKTLEEPHSHSTVFLVVANISRLLPTLRSRLVVLEAPEEEGADASAFLKASPAKRLEMVSDIVEKKDKAAARRLLRGAARTLHARMQTDPSLAQTLRSMEETARFLDDQSSSVKLILEHACLTIPVIGSRD